MSDTCLDISSYSADYKLRQVFFKVVFLYILLTRQNTSVSNIAACKLSFGMHPVRFALKWFQLSKTSHVHISGSVVLSARWATELLWQPPEEYICEIIEMLCMECIILYSSGNKITTTTVPANNLFQVHKNNNVFKLKKTIWNCLSLANISAIFTYETLAVL